MNKTHRIEFKDYVLDKCPDYYQNFENNVREKSDRCDQAVSLEIRKALKEFNCRFYLTDGETEITIPEPYYEEYDILQIKGIEFDTAEDAMVFILRWSE